MIGTLIGAGLGIASSIIGGAASARANREAERKLREQHSRDQAWYNRRYNEDYADTAAGQNLIRQAKDYARENWKKAQGSAAVGGGTDAAVALAKEGGNKVVADTLSNIAAQDTARKANVDNINMQNERNYTQQMAGIDQQRANNISHVAGAASDALMKAGTAYDGFDSGSTASNVKTNTGGNASRGVKVDPNALLHA